MKSNEELREMADKIAEEQARSPDNPEDFDHFNRYNEFAGLAEIAFKMWQADVISAKELLFLADIEKYPMLSEKQFIWAEHIATRMLLQQFD